MKNIFLTAFIYAVMVLSLDAQQNPTFKESRPTFIGLNLDYGFILKHSESLKNLDSAHPSALTIDWSKLLLTQKAWDFCNCFPRVGVDLGYWNWDNPEVLGKGALAMGYIEPYFKTQKRSHLFLEWAWAVLILQLLLMLLKIRKTILTVLI